MKADTKIVKKKDGSRYSKMIKKGGFDIIAFLHQAIEEKSFWTILRLLLRTLWLGWSIPFGFILKKIRRPLRRSSGSRRPSWRRTRPRRAALFSCGKKRVWQS